MPAAVDIAQSLHLALTNVQTVATALQALAAQLPQVVADSMTVLAASNNQQPLSKAADSTPGQLPVQPASQQQLGVTVLDTYLPAAVDGSPSRLQLQAQCRALQADLQEALSYRKCCKRLQADKERLLGVCSGLQLQLQEHQKQQRSHVDAVPPLHPASSGSEQQPLHGAIIHGQQQLPATIPVQLLADEHMLAPLAEDPAIIQSTPVCGDASSSQHLSSSSYREKYHKVKQQLQALRRGYNELLAERRAGTWQQAGASQANHPLVQGPDGEAGTQGKRRRSQSPVLPLPPQPQANNNMALAAPEGLVLPLLPNPSITQQPAQHAGLSAQPWPRPGADYAATHAPPSIDLTMEPVAAAGEAVQAAAAPCRNATEGIGRPPAAKRRRPDAPQGSSTAAAAASCLQIAAQMLGSVEIAARPAGTDSCFRDLAGQAGVGKAVSQQLPAGMSRTTGQPCSMSFAGGSTTAPPDGEHVPASQGNPSGKDARKKSKGPKGSSSAASPSYASGGEVTSPVRKQRTGTAMDNQASVAPPIAGGRRGDTLKVRLSHHPSGQGHGPSMTTSSWGSQLPPTKELLVSSRTALPEIPLTGSTVPPTAELLAASRVPPTAELLAADGVPPLLAATTAEMLAASVVPPTAELLAASRVPHTADLPMASTVPATAELLAASVVPPTIELQGDPQSAHGGDTAAAAGSYKSTLPISQAGSHCRASAGTDPVRHTGSRRSMGSHDTAADPVRRTGGSGNKRCDAVAPREHDATLSDQGDCGSSQQQCQAAATSAGAGRPQPRDALDAERNDCFPTPAVALPPDALWRPEAAADAHAGSFVLQHSHAIRTMLAAYGSSPTDGDDLTQPPPPHAASPPPHGALTEQGAGTADHGWRPIPQHVQAPWQHPADLPRASGCANVPLPALDSARASLPPAVALQDLSPSRASAQDAAAAHGPQPHLPAPDSSPVAMPMSAGGILPPAVAPPPRQRMEAPQPTPLPLQVTVHLEQVTTHLAVARVTPLPTATPTALQLGRGTALRAAAAAMQPPLAAVPSLQAPQPRSMLHSTVGAGKAQQLSYGCARAGTPQQQLAREWSDDLDLTQPPPPPRPTAAPRSVPQGTANGRAPSTHRQTVPSIDAHAGQARTCVGLRTEPPGPASGEQLPGGVSGNARPAMPSAQQHSAGSRPSGAQQPAPPAVQGYRYTEVVRKQALREALPGHECVDCANFYAALATWGTVLPNQGPACGHAAAAAAGRGGQANTAEALRQDVSRHRYRYAPPATPDGFWDLGFPDSMDTRSD